MARVNVERTPLDNGALAARIRAGETTIGTFAGLASTTSIEVMAASGLDWILVDLEHGGGPESSIGAAAAVTGGYGAATLARVEKAERIRIGRVLDAGAAGVMLPRLGSAEETAAALPHFRYPPEGDRGVATYNRSARWGLDPDALQRSNNEMLTIVQIETLGALDDVEKIAALDGVDVLFIGPLDLSFALGVARQFDSEPFRRAVDRVLAAAAKERKSAGILSANASIARQRADEGFTFLPVGSDSTLLAEAAATVMTTLRG